MRALSLKSLFGGGKARPPGAAAPRAYPAPWSAALPEEVRLPRPADPISRLGAGMFDALAAGVVGAGCAAAALYGAGCPDAVAAATGQGAALGAWVLRDVAADSGTRSLGKRVFGLELAMGDGSLAPPSAAALRSCYWLLLPAAGLHPFVALTAETLLVFDAATLALTLDARKAGDYALGTRVVEARAGREQRAADAADAAELAELRARVEAEAPGLLASRGADGAGGAGGRSLPPQPWFAEAAARAPRGGVATGVATGVGVGAAGGITPPHLPPPMPSGGLFGEILGAAPPADAPLEEPQQPAVARAK